MDNHVSIKEAARLTGKSEQTIRRAIKRGDLEARKEGGKYQILISRLSKLYHFDQAVQSDQVASQETNQAELSAIIAILREQLSAKDEQIATLTQALQAQQLITAELTKRLPALEEKPQEPSSWWARMRSRLG